MRILITGGTGYVGRALTRSLYDLHEVTVVDTLRYGNRRFDDRERGRFRLITQDICDLEGLRRVFCEVEPELVIHLAAIHYIPECEANPDRAILVNVLGTSNVCQACPDGAALVFTSSAAVYAPDDTPHVESSSPVGPTDVYGLTKLHGEEYLHYWARQKSLRAAIIRLFNVIGPGETNPHVLPAIISQLLAGRRTLQLGNCHPRRDYINVEDVVSGIQAIAFGLDASPGVDVVNLGTGFSYSVYSLVEQLSEIVGDELTIESDPARVRATDRALLQADIRHIREQYGWQPTLTITETLRQLWLEPDLETALAARA